MRLAVPALLLLMLLAGAAPVGAEEDPAAPAPSGEKPADEAKRPGRVRGHHLDLAVDRLEHDFGVVGQNKELETTITYTNAGEKAVAGIRAQADCGCNRVELSHDELGPGESGTLTVSFQTGVLSGKLQKRVRLVTKERSRGEITIRLGISIVSGLILDPGAVRFGDVVFGSLPTAQFGVKWFDGKGKPFEVTKIEIPGHEEALEAKVTPYVPEAEDDRWRGYVVDVRFKKAPPLGMYSAHLLVRTNHPEFARMELPLSANVVGRVWIQSRVMHFGVVEKGTRRTARLKFRPNDATTEFADVRATARGGKLEVQVGPDPLHKEKRLWVLEATVPADAAEGRLDDEVIELHTGVPGEEVILVRVRGRVRARRG
ncbi:MAG: DUF1573 domain-containing protein [Planctomycetota bacterium]|nr:DUF1573 domain-containing protein [Planctomycetota bacterium]